jgi:hypothetical protein
MTQYIVPNLGASGVIKLKDPFAGLCAANTPYTVTSIQTLQDIVADGQDPFALYYSPFGLDQTVYAQDINDRVCIVSLTPSDGDVVRVPNSYLISLPIAMGIPYATMMVGINLGALPQDLSLAYFMTQVAELAHDLLGVDNAAVRAMRASSLTYLSVDDAATIEAARQTVMQAVTTETARRLAAETALNALQQKYNDLEAYALAHTTP